MTKFLLMHCFKIFNLMGLIVCSKHANVKLLFSFFFRFWEREKDVESLFDLTLTPAATELIMERDAKTGKLQSIKEVRFNN